MKYSQIKDMCIKINDLYFHANLSLNSGYKGIPAAKLERMVNMGRKARGLNYARLSRRINCI